jgi:hypothetical protein
MRSGSERLPPDLTRERMMILQLRSRLASGLIVSTIGMTGATLGTAADAPAASGTAAGAAKAPNASTPSSATPGSAPSSATPASTTGAAPSAHDDPAREIFDQLDSNHDGALSFEEFARATFQQPAK